MSRSSGDPYRAFIMGALIGMIVISIAFSVMDSESIHIDGVVADELCKELSGNSAAEYLDDRGDVFDCVIREEVRVLDDGLIVIHDERGRTD